MTQGTSKPNTINHFSHDHPLTEVNGVASYTCNGCNLYGDGKTYRCNDCDYDLHEYCAMCPTTLRNTWHVPGHELSLITGATHKTERLCFVCRVFIEGMFYKCNHCVFESHPLCTHVPMHFPSLDATVTKQRSLHDHPQHYGQGNLYGYAHMDPYGAYPYGGYHHYHPYMNPSSPNEDTPKKQGLVVGTVKAIVEVTGAVANDLVSAAITNGMFF